MGLFGKKKSHSGAGQVDMGRLPRHIAIIMDGNGRWAKQRGLPRTAGHKVGAETFRKIATYCKDLGVQYLTVYAFSTENWKRPADEVSTIMGLLKQYMLEAIDSMERDQIRLRFLGDLSTISPELQALIEKTNEIFSHIEGFQADGGGLRPLPLFRRDSRPGSDHPPERRAAPEQLPVVAVRLCGVLFLRHALARLRRAGARCRHHRLSEARPALRRRQGLRHLALRL